MNEDIVISAISSCLSNLESFVTATILLAIAVIWPALRNHHTVEFISIKVDRKYAFSLVATIYLFINTAIAFLFLRLVFLIELFKPGDGLQKALDTIATHSWILNPYSYFGDTLSALLYSSTTYGLLIIVWWFCFASLHALGNNPKSLSQKTFEITFLLIGLASLLAMQWAGFLMYLKVDDGVDVYHGINSIFIGKGIMSFVSIGIGVALFWWLDKIKNNHIRKAENA